MEDDSGDQISVSFSNSSVTIASGDQLDVADSPAIVWVADDAGHDINIKISNAGWITSDSSQSFALGDNADQIYGSLTFNNKRAGEVDTGMTFYGLTDAATVTIVNNGRILGENSYSPLELSTDGASFSITNGIHGEIVGTDTAIDGASNTVINNHGVITLDSDRAAKAYATRDIGYDGGAAIDLEDGTNDVINNYTGAYIDGGEWGIRGQQGDVTINNEVGALIHASSGTAIYFSAKEAMLTGHAVTINNAGEIIGNSRATDELGVVAAMTSKTALVASKTLAEPGAIGVAGRLDLVNSGLVTEASIVPDTKAENFSAAVIAAGGKIENHGTIIGVNIAIETLAIASRLPARLSLSDQSAMTIKNDGFIQGGADGAIVLTGSENDKLLNSGHIVGNVDMGDGNDLVKLSGASDIDGSILLGAGNDVFKGSAAAEDIYGGKGADRMTGGGGDDVFHFAHGDSGTKRINTDTIMDFTSHDTLDLSAIDADSHSKKDNKFHFIGADAFSGHAGELHYEQKGHDTWLSGDTNGDGKADFAIDLHGLLTLTKDEFVL